MALRIDQQFLAGTIVAAMLSAGCAGSPGSGSGSGSPTPAPSATEPPLRVAAIPYEDPQKESEQYVGFGNYLGQKVNGQDAKVAIASDYVGVVISLENKQADVAYLSPYSYALAADRAVAAGHPLVLLAMPYVIPSGQTRGSLTYEGVIFTRADSGIRTLKDLKGKTFAFNEQTSASGYLYPAMLLLAAGVNPQPESRGGDLKQVFFAGAQGVVPSVFNRQSDAGAIFEEGIRLSLSNPADRAQIKVIQRTDPIPNGMLVARGDLAPDEIKKLRDAIVSINTAPEGKAALAKMHVEKWAPANDSMFDKVRQTARKLGLTLETSSMKS